ncbi:MAG: aminotransferase class I/II-fold pyridoxal phosphate-dependent enzyme [Candidatus Pacebacteria bacterium]|nr:aminotransferase class I/II-fold pyridoxal phosphate-dependent enzyme [Candidatus Paceibacterota bacterium]
MAENERNKHKAVSSALELIFLKANKLEEKGADVIHLEVGDPYKPTPDRIKQAAKEAINSNRVFYTPASGSDDLKEAIIEKYRRKQCKIYFEEIVASHGSRPVISGVLKVLAGKGDKIFIPAPYYPSFLGLSKQNGAQAVLINTRNYGFKLKAAEVQNKINKIGAPKVLILNSPNNPTGVEYDRSEIEKICALAQKYDFWIISDECYQSFSKDKHFTMRQIYSKAIVIDSCSKEYSMTGWRIGWGLMSEDIAAEVKKYLGLFVSSLCTISEAAAIEAFKEDGVYNYEVQKNIICDWLDKKRIDYVRPEGCLYVFPDFSNYLKSRNGPQNSLTLSEFLLEKSQVAVAPGIAFGDYDSYLRLCFCVDKNRLKEALNRIERCLVELV